MRVLYQPLSLIASVLGGIAATAVFRKLWTATTGENDAPDATDPGRTWSEVVTAAAVQGAVFGGVKAVVDRGAATGFKKATGKWPKR